MNFAYKLMALLVAVSLLTVLLGVMSPNMVTAETIMPEIKVNNKVISCEGSFTKDNCVYISAEACKDIFGAEIAYSNEFVEIADENKASLFFADSKDVLVNNKECKLENNTVLKDGNVFLPLGEVCSLFDAEFSESGSNAEITYKPAKKDIGNGKKVYALYHTLRGTRVNDGMNLNWDACYENPTTKTGRTHSIYNADLLDESGKHKVASINGGPLVGMGSDLDDDYLEYEVLLGKAGGLDGFALDFAFVEHTGTAMQNSMIKQSEKYGFEVSIDYTDSSAVNTTWIENYRNDIIGRDARVQYVKTGIQYLLDTVYSSKAGSYIGEHPLMFFFGGGLQLSDYTDVLGYNYNMPENAEKMYVVRRYPFSGTYSDGEVSFKDNSIWDQWINIGVDTHTWCPDRVRPIDENNLNFDSYASFDDMKKYQEQAVDYWKTGKKANINVACAMPGFDNRGCGAWGSSSLKGFDRYDGELYRWQWNYFVENKNLIDVVFVGSWNDFTEGHEIQPSVLNGYREMETTQEFSARLKDKEYLESEKSNLRIPQEIYSLRKNAEKYQQIGFDTTECEKTIDGAALGFSRGEILTATTLINSVNEKFAEFDKNIEIETIICKNDDFVITNGDGIETDKSKGIIMDNIDSVTASDEKGGAAARAVDGMLSDYSCWQTSTQSEEYYLQINFKTNYNFTGVRLYSGTDSGKNVVERGELQYFDNDVWKTIAGTEFSDNKNASRYFSFANTVKTDKLRFISKDGNKGCRVREIVPYVTYESKLLADEEIIKNTPIKYKKGENIALSAAVTSNGSNSGYPVQNLIDGKTSDDSRWIYTSASGNYWAELDFGEEQSIVAADVNMGKSDGTWALSNFYIEYLIDGEWKVISGTEVVNNKTSNTDMSLTFDKPVTTSKVRFVCTDGANGCRVRELAIYANGGIDDTVKTGNSIRGMEIAGIASVTSNCKTSKGNLKNIVDNNMSDLSYWMSSTDENKYTIEFNFEDKYDITGTDIYSGYENGTWAFKNVTIQYFDGVDWRDVNGGKITDNPKDCVMKKWNFDEIVNTDRLRFVFSDGTRGVKIREIKIYSKAYSIDEKSDDIIRPQNNTYLALNENVRNKLNDFYFEGSFSYDIFAENAGSMTVKGCSVRPTKKVGVNYADYSVISQTQNIKTDGWETQRVELYKKNLCFTGKYKNSSDFVIWGVNPLKNLQMTFTVYKKVK